MEIEIIVYESWLKPLTGDKLTSELTGKVYSRALRRANGQIVIYPLNSSEATIALKLIRGYLAEKEITR